MQGLGCYYSVEKRGGCEMRKAYSKPDIGFESFALSESIAAGCEERPFNFLENCGVKYGKQIIFTDAIQNCTRKVIDGQQGEYNGLCYHNPSASYNVFVS